MNKEPQPHYAFWFGVLGFLKALIWPVMLVYKLLEFLKM